MQEDMERNSLKRIHFAHVFAFLVINSIENNNLKSTEGVCTGCFFFFWFLLGFDLFFQAARTSSVHPHIFPVRVRRWGSVNFICIFFSRFSRQWGILMQNGADTNTVQAEHTTDQRDATVSSCSMFNVYWWQDITARSILPLLRIQEFLRWHFVLAMTEYICILYEASNQWDCEISSI